MGITLLPTDAWSCLAERLQISLRERQIAEAILDDRKEPAIAKQLGISPHTVHTHLERLYRKLGVNSRLQLSVRLANEAIRCHLSHGRSLSTSCYHCPNGCPLDC